MTKTVETIVSIGDWVKPPPERSGTQAKYINITERNVESFNEKFNDSLSKGSYFLVEGEELKEAENYLLSLIDVKVGDYINVGRFKMPHGEIDKIVELPEVENIFDIQSYKGSVKTERGNSLWYLRVPDEKVSPEGAKEYFTIMRQRHLNTANLFEKQLKELNSKF